MPVNRKKFKLITFVVQLGAVYLAFHGIGHSQERYADIDADLLKSKNIDPRVVEKIFRSSQPALGRSVVRVYINGIDKGLQELNFHENGKFCFEDKKIGDLGLTEAAFADGNCFEIGRNGEDRKSVV